MSADLIQFPRAFKPRVVSEWRPKRDSLVLALGQCCRVMAVDGDVVIVSGRNALGHAWTVPMHVGRVRPWREPMARMAEVMGAHMDRPCDTEPPGAA